MIPYTRAEFKEYCLQALGKGVLQINVSDDQVEDRIDESLYLYRQFHMDAVSEEYLAHQTTGSTIQFTADYTGTFQNGEPLTNSTNATCYVINTVNSSAIHVYHNPNNPRVLEGDTITGKLSGATGTVANTVDAGLVLSSNGTFVVGEQIYGATSRALGLVTTQDTTNGVATLGYTSVLGTFLVSEVVIGQTSSANGTLTSKTAKTTGIELGDIDLGYFEIPDEIIAVRRVFPPFDSRISADILFDPQAQFNISLLSNFTSNSIIPYYIGRQYQQLLNDTFRGRPGLRFSRHMNRIYIDVKWPTTVLPGHYFIVECAKVIDPNVFPDIWSDRWLQRYAIAVIKRQWGMNLSKFTGIALPGGVQLDGRAMLSEANQECKDLEQELKDTYQEPPIFFTG